MQNWIAGLLAVLGTLLVLAGGTLTVFKTIGPAPSPATEPLPGEPAPPASGSLLRRLNRLSGADRLVAWGVVLLVLGAIAAGAISFNLGASAGTR